MSKSRFACPGRGALVVVGVTVVSLLAPLVARADSGATLTPDRHSYVVNKDVGNERWTINLNLASLSPQRAINVTGNVYRRGQSPSFVWCQERDDSTGTLSDPNSTFRLRCSGASACGETATGCARSEWTLIADPVEIPASFFLPPGGEGLASTATRIAGADAIPAAVTAPTAPVASQPSLSLTQNLAASSPPSSPAANEDRGANLPPDGANFLVNKELGGLRWSISLNQIPAQRGNSATASCSGDALECIVTKRFLSVTGNVFPLDGSAPQFVWCQERQDSTGDLSNPSSEFRFGCVGAVACTRTANECASEDWQVIPGGADIRLNASFFLPPGGLPASVQSDPEIVIIGRTSDPPSIVVPLGAGAASVAATDAATVQGGSCQEGAACTTSVGSCGAVQGRVVNDSAVGCACLVTDVPPACIVCGDGASGQCGGDCQYQTGGGTARGQCLPFSSTSSACACYAANQRDQVAISICGGALGAECPADKCCTDDVRDGCDPSRGDTECQGICVDANGCDPTSGQCGSCFDQSAGQTLFCGSLEAPHGASCCDDCPDGSTSCYCEPGRSCNLESDGGGCCPTSRPDICNGSACIPSGADCCSDCPDGGTSCYCAAGSLCVLETDGGGCCPLEKPVGCGGFCLPEGSDCCPDGTSYCDPGSLCTAELTCVPAGEDDCGGGLFCDAGYQCVDDSPGCCRTDLTCDTACLTNGEDCCGDGFFCDAGSVCVGVPGADGGCCPEDLPVLCGDSCFAAGTVCDSQPSSTSAERTPARSRPDSLQSIWSDADAAPRTGMLARHAGASSNASSATESTAAKQQ